MRISMGDMAVIAPSEYLTQGENYIFWVVWICCVLIQCIVFMNFIVAEAGNTYNEVSEQLQQVIQQQLSALASEAEELLPKCLQNGETMFPRYVISRRVDDGAESEEEEEE